MKKISPYKTGIVLSLVFVAGTIPLCVLYYQYYTAQIEFTQNEEIKSGFQLISVLSALHVFLGGFTLYLLAFGRSKYLKQAAKTELESNESPTPVEKTTVEIDPQAVAKDLFNTLKKKRELHLEPFFYLLLNKLDACLGTLYLYENKKLSAQFSYGYVLESVNALELGENLPSQAAKNKEVLTIENIPEGYMKVETGLGKEAPTNLWFYPVLMNNKLIAVIEVAGFKAYSTKQGEIINTAFEKCWEQLKNPDQKQ